MVWGEMCHSSGWGRCYLLSWSWYQPWLPRPRASVSSSQWSHSSRLMAHITSHSPASDWSAWPRPGLWLADIPGCCSHHATQRGLTPNCKLRFLGVGRLGTLEMGSPLSQTGPQTLMDSCILILRGMWCECEASDYQHSWISTHRVMFAKYCHLSVIHLTVTTVYFHLGVSVSPQTTSCYVLIKVFAKREEREERQALLETPDADRHAASENNRECLTVVCV